MRIAVITGASSGMGREFVKGIAGDEPLDAVWVIARREERLASLQAEISIPVRPIALDLTKSESIEAYRALLAAEQPEVVTLVNASGFGKFRLTMDAPLDELLGMIDLNDKALVAMTHVTLPYMPKGARIFNLCSRSSFQPVPYINVYAASKAFVLSFSRALNVELRQKGIRVLAICPGWIRTEFFERAQTAGDDSVTRIKPVREAAGVVKTALRDDRRGKDVSVYGFSERLERVLVKLLPHRLVMRIWMRQQRHPW